MLGIPKVFARRGGHAEQAVYRWGGCDGRGPLPPDGQQQKGEKKFPPFFCFGLSCLALQLIDELYRVSSDRLPQRLSRPVEVGETLFGFFSCYWRSGLVIANYLTGLQAPQELA